MGIESLTDLEIVYGTFTLSFVLISILLGVIFLYKSAKLKRKDIFTLGIAWICLSSPWWGDGFSFLTVILFNSALEPFIYLALDNVFIPVAILAWMYSFTTILYPDSKKVILTIFLVFCIVYEAIIIVLLSIDLSLIGTIKETFYYQPELIPMIFQLIALTITIVTGLMFSFKSLKIEDEILRWKARFLLVAFISFFLGALIETVIEMNALSIVFVRLILISSAIEYYLGFLLPDRIAELLTGKKSSN